ncbi:MAG: bifunctional folylpolyglutamate synthase/dihydrofolate synthase [Deltaproteobacteria bacterium]|nr:bifunctional folylpolyglutamate synthase/dihydrofolate synthase [Deltaproteobacteria bacterium]
MQNGLSYLNSLGLHKVKPGLERIKEILKSFGNPESKVPGIIIAGTNGKGSVASAVSSILSAQGYQVGLYTSPHLVNITERITINGVQISNSDLSSIILEIKKAAEQFLSETPSYFEVLTAAAFVYFAREKVNFSVLEVGMGGRWDATNVITPLASIITNISKDHSEYLGEKISDIAEEKACIIKPGVPVITAAVGDAFDVIEKKAIKNSSPIIVNKREFKTEGENTDNFSYKGINWEIENLKSNLKGHYQLEILSLAIAALEAIQKNHKIKIDESFLRQGVANIEWEGRFEILSERPLLILDSAHNPGAAKSLVKSIRDSYPDTKFTFLAAMLEDKGHEQFLKEISSIAEKLIITKVPSERTADPKQLTVIAQKYIEEIETIDDYKSAYEAILHADKPSCITGSLYLIGAIKRLTN